MAMAMAMSAITPKHEPIIPGLPDDIAMNCLLKVPITSHPSLRLVSHGWRSAISDPSFYTHRRRLGSAERLLFLLGPPPQNPPATGKDSPESTAPPPLSSYNLSIFNLSCREWRRLAALPIPMFAQCVAVPAAGKVVVLGGWDPVTLEPVSRVLVIDLTKGIWKEGSSMPVARSFFACSSATGTSSIYVAGGHDGRKNALRSAAVYDVVLDQWRVLPEMSEERDECHGLTFDNDSSKFWVISGYGTENQGIFRPDCEVFDPETESWTRIEGVWPYPSAAPRTTAGGGGRRWLFVGEGGEVREFDWEEKRWNGANSGRVPKTISGSSSNLLVNVGEEGDEIERIFVIGNGGNCEGECDEEGCGGEGVFILERENQERNTNSNKGCGAIWKHVHAPCGFLGFPFSASQLFI